MSKLILCDLLHIDKSEIRLALIVRPLKPFLFHTMCKYDILETENQT